MFPNRYGDNTQSQKSLFGVDTDKYNQQLNRNNMLAVIRDDRVQSIATTSSSNGCADNRKQSLRSLYVDDDAAVNSRGTQSYSDSTADRKGNAIPFNYNASGVGATTATDATNLNPNNLPMYKVLKKGQEVYVEQSHMNSHAPAQNRQENSLYYPAKIVSVMHSGYASARYDVILTGFESLGIRTVSWEQISLSDPSKATNTRAGPVLDPKLMYVKEVIINDGSGSSSSRNQPTHLSYTIREWFIFFVCFIRDNDDEYNYQSKSDPIDAMAMLQTSKYVELAHAYKQQINVNDDVAQSKAVPALSSAPPSSNLQAMTTASAPSQSDLLVASILARRQALKQAEQDEKFAQDVAEREKEAAKQAHIIKERERQRERMLQMERERLQIGEATDGIPMQEPRISTSVRACENGAVIDRSLPTDIKSAVPTAVQTRSEEKVAEDNTVINSAILKANRAAGGWRKR
jgi:hypothetical protein